MRYRELSPTGDYMFGNGEADFLINSPQAVAQVVKTYLKLFLGEWYLNVNDGTPWFQGVLGFHSQAEADEALQQTILSLPGIQNLTNWSSSVSPINRQYSATGTLYTIYGTTPLVLNNLGTL